MKNVESTTAYKTGFIKIIDLVFNTNINGNDNGVNISGINDWCRVSNLT